MDRVVTKFSLNFDFVSPKLADKLTKKKKMVNLFVSKGTIKQYFHEIFANF